MDNFIETLAAFGELVIDPITGAVVEVRSARRHAKKYNLEDLKNGGIRKISTPSGIFDTAVECAAYHGISRSLVATRISKKLPGWEYIYVTAI